MLWDRKRLLGYDETIQLVLGVTDKTTYNLEAEPGKLISKDANQDHLFSLSVYQSVLYSIKT